MSDRKIKMAYYKSEVEIRIPENNLIDVLIPGEIQKAADLECLIHHHLDNPIGTPPFSELCRDKSKICVIICDLTRPMENHRVLPVVLERIRTENPHAQVNILIAQGTHRPLTQQEKIYLCGEEICKNYAVLDHAFDNPAQLRYIETSRPDFPIMVNRQLYESDFKVAIGAVKPHPIFGWSGGAKVIIPGVSGAETTGLSHWNSCPFKGTEIMGFEENPVRAEVEDTVGREKLLDFILNAVLTDSSEIADLRCGHFIEAHRACVKIAKEYYLKDVSEPADAVIVGVGKWGADLWVGSMGIYQAEFYLKKGGTIVVLAACPEGISPTHPEIAEYGYQPFAKVKQMLERGIIKKDLTLAAHLVHVGRVLEAREAECVMISEGISPGDIEKIGFIPMKSPDEILPYLKKKHGDNVRILAIPGFNSTTIICGHPVK